MKYACLIYSNESTDPEPGSEAFMPLMAGYAAFGEKYNDRIDAGEALTGTNAATSVQVRDGKTITTDGPFAETKEQLGGFYIIEAEDLDHAIAIASEIPTASHGTVEVRPVMVFD